MIRKPIKVIDVKFMGRLTRVRFHKSNLTAHDRNTWAKYAEY